MKRLLAIACVLISTRVSASCAADTPAPLKVAIVGLEHGHVGGMLHGGPLAPAGGILRRDDVELVGVVEQDRRLFDAYAARYHLAPGLRYDTVAAMVAAVHPRAVLVFTAPDLHRQVVEACAPLGVHVMMEKPLALTYDDALAIQRAADNGKIHVLVDYETSWYASNAEAYRLLKSGALGPVVKTVFRDGHSGPKAIGVPPEFLSWLIDPKRGGDGALTDFGCYGPSLATWLMDGQVPQSVTAVTRRLQPEANPDVDDEADVLLTYPSAVSVVQASWDWPFSIKEMDVYGRTGYAKSIDLNQLEVHKARQRVEPATRESRPAAPYDDPMHYLEAVLSGRIQEGNDPSSLKTNLTVTEILEAAVRSARTGKAVTLPLGQ